MKNATQIIQLQNGGKAELFKDNYAFLYNKKGDLYYWGYVNNDLQPHGEGTQSIKYLFQDKKDIKQGTWSNGSFMCGYIN